ncbi:efflux RND transporter periplasmic adaptor subunit [Caldimonas tepidiphila]|uniref:efflux RND transporter periplasmic adaptor subunit n=1 Tax=Caldimonas tepidiphila TaxID=2315841 RepID=UPI000E5AF801|nr:efflux RND transporter periplasmic adaptor subunit [Caldimonas tepidiphila]
MSSTAPPKRIRITPGRIAALLVLLLAAGLALWRWQFAAPPPPQYLTAPATVADIEDTVLAAGTIEAAKQVSVGAQVSGQLKSLKVALGDTVTQGQLLAEIDSLPQQNTLRKSQAEIETVQAQRRARQAALKQAELAHARARQLFEADATSRQSLEAAQASLDTLRAEVAQLDAQIAQARVTLDTARLNLGYTRITAPMDGVVVAVVAEEGRTLNANQSAPTILKLARMDRVTVKAQISEGDVTRVRPGLPVYFTILGDPDRRYEATLRAIEPAPESIRNESTTSTGTGSSSTQAIYYNGLFDVPNPDGRLRISMTAQVFVVLGRASQALTIPASALGPADGEGRHPVRVVSGRGDAQRVETRLVRTGLNNRLQVQVLEGLRAGERVVIGETAAGARSETRQRRQPGMF